MRRLWLKPGRFVDNSKQPSQINGPVGGVSREHVQFFYPVEQSKLANMAPLVGNTFCRPRRNGNMPVGGSTTSIFGKPKHPCKSQFRRKRIRKSITVGSYHQTIGVFTICTGMSANGRRLGCCLSPSHQIDPTGRFRTRCINRGEHGYHLLPMLHLLAEILLIRTLLRERRFPQLQKSYLFSPT